MQPHEVLLRALICKSTIWQKSRQVVEHTLEYPDTVASFADEAWNSAEKGRQQTNLTFVLQERWPVV